MRETCWTRSFVFVVFVPFWLGCSSTSTTTAPDVGVETSADVGVDTADTADEMGLEIGTPGGGQVLYSLGDRAEFYLIPATGGVGVGLSARFSRLGLGREDKMNISKNGGHFVVSTTRLGCASNPCLARFQADGSRGEKITPSGLSEVNVYGSSQPSISPDGTTIVVTQQNGTRTDLFASSRSSAGVWSALIPLTNGTSYSRNQFSTISADGKLVAFSCGNTDDETDRNNICQVGITGMGYRTLVVAGSSNAFTNTLRPTFANNGDVIFEGILPPGKGSAKTEGERIWRLAASTSSLSPLGDYLNNVGPCALSNGKVASLWLGRPGGTGVHELMVVDADGIRHSVLLPSQDVDDIGLGCSD